MTTLRTARLTLRKPRLEDAAALHLAMREPAASDLHAAAPQVARCSTCNAELPGVQQDPARPCAKCSAPKEPGP